jgi:hypothetical protein
MSMNGRTVNWLAAAGAAALLAGCAGKPAPAPVPSQQDSPAPPLTPGDWSYSESPGGSVARFGPAGGEIFSLRCDSGRRRILLNRAGSGAALRIGTTYGQSARAAPELAADDPLLDEMAFSRGRFTVEAEGLAPLILPTWPEPARVIDDCRS